MLPWLNLSNPSHFYGLSFYGFSSLLLLMLIPVLLFPQTCSFLLLFSKSELPPFPLLLPKQQQLLHFDRTSSFLMHINIPLVLSPNISTTVSLQTSILPGRRWMQIKHECSCCPTSAPYCCLHQNILPLRRRKPSREQMGKKNPN